MNERHILYLHTKHAHSVLELDEDDPPSGEQVHHVLLPVDVHRTLVEAAAVDVDEHGQQRLATGLLQKYFYRFSIFL